MSEDWGPGFFTGLLRELWRQANPPKRSAEEAGFLEAMLAAKAGAPLLDLPCGEGRLALELARRGYSLTGLDANPALLRTAHTHARRGGLACTGRRGDLRTLPGDWVGAFAGAFCMGNSFGTFPPEDSAVFLREVGAVLQPGAHLVLDTDVSAEGLLPELEHRVWEPVGELRVLVENHYDYEESRLDTTYTVLKGARRETRTARHWVLTIGEIRRMLRAAGLEPLAQYGSLECDPFDYGGRRLLLGAEKV